MKAQEEKSERSKRTNHFKNIVVVVVVSLFSLYILSLVQNVVKLQAKTQSKREREIRMRTYLCMYEKGERERKRA